MTYWIIALTIGLVFAIIMIIRTAHRIPGTLARNAEKNARYCTKHVIHKSMIPGGPDTLDWVYGPHRTPGNACDGQEHIRKTGWS